MYFDLLMIVNNAAVDDELRSRSRSSTTAAARVGEPRGQGLMSMIDDDGPL